MFKTQQHLINIIKDTADHHPNFVLFLGAGASVTSGVPCASKMINEWRQKYVAVAAEYVGKAIADPEVALKDERWFDRPEEYSRLFEFLFDQPTQRREYIESKLKNASPSWGYIYLVNLIKNRVFNAIFTTNFDDLLNESCYLYSDELRPIVCAHDSSIKYVRITSKRPKIIKLHGDFLFDNIKNTVSELESLEDNMKEKFRQYASEFGFIFVGYSGNDRSIMDVVSTLLRSDGYFPHGIYWCARESRVENLSQSIQDLSRHPRFNLVSISDFDAFCADLHNGMQLKLQSELADPYGSLQRKLDNLLNRAGVSDQTIHPVIDKDIQSLARSIKKRFASSEKTDPVHPEAVPVENQRRAIKPPSTLLAQIAEREKNYSEAIGFALSALAESASMDAARVAISSASHLEDPKFAARAVEAILGHPKLFQKEPWPATSMVVSLIKGKKLEAALQLVRGVRDSVESAPKAFDEYQEINEAQILRHMGEELPEQIADRMLEINEVSADPLARFGAAIVLGELDSAIGCIRHFPSNGPTMEDIMSWPIIDLIDRPGRGRLLGEIRQRFVDHDRQIIDLPAVSLTEEKSLPKEDTA
jgi:hypothetical protein